MNHFQPRLAHVHRALREARLGTGNVFLGLGHGQMTIAARPIGTPEAGIRQAHVGTEDHHDQAQNRGDDRQAIEPVHLSSQAFEGAHFTASAGWQ